LRRPLSAGLIETAGEQAGDVAAGPAPRLGEDTQAVPGEALGIDAAAFSQLGDRGIVGAADARWR
jgi:hypothetical protein